MATRSGGRAQTSAAHPVPAINDKESPATDACPGKRIVFPRTRLNAKFKLFLQRYKRSIRPKVALVFEHRRLYFDLMGVRIFRFPN
jgi:hypothetical protein